MKLFRVQNLLSWMFLCLNVLAALYACVGQQTLTLGMNDTFFFALIACAVCAVATLFVGHDPALEEARAAKKRGEKGGESAPMTATP